MCEAPAFHVIAPSATIHRLLTQKQVSIMQGVASFLWVMLILLLDCMATWGLFHQGIVSL